MRINILTKKPKVDKFRARQMAGKEVGDLFCKEMS